MDSPLTALSAQIPLGKLDLFLELSDPEWNVAAYTDAETRTCRVDLFLEEVSLADATEAAFRNALELIGEKPEIGRSVIAKEDWQESWKRFFHVERVSPRIVVRPAWEEYEAKPGEIVFNLDPGMSFGTGKHETTKACLQFLDELAAENSGRSVLDMGCGTGILAICAKKLGFEKVRAFDIDPDCIQSTKENAERNAVEIPVETGDLSKAWPQHDIVVANILAPVLTEFAKNVAASVIDGGDLILSGILDTQYPSVKAAYEAQGLIEQRSVLIGEWRSGHFSKR